MTKQKPIHKETGIPLLMRNFTESPNIAKRKTSEIIKKKKIGKQQEKANSETLRSVISSILFLMLKGSIMEK